MFLQMNDSRAFQCFRNAIDVYVKHGMIYQAIANCFLYGYKIGKGNGNTIMKRMIFYIRGELLRAQYKIPHTCAIIKVEDSEYCNLPKVVVDRRNRCAGPVLINIWNRGDVHISIV
ncbi:hypothetical protein RF11_14482 [Thelohanellus kitauei]|uniref:Uncharacterized protein n=1 Tax=Thelohanellus kitauei TaxID=669202 RepID=A0A0C2NF67_THEKT|nr:hypothetical protein RF11_14482 [Thelohanellus kitauei]